MKLLQTLSCDNWLIGDNRDFMAIWVFFSALSVNLLRVCFATLSFNWVSRL